MSEEKSSPIPDAEILRAQRKGAPPVPPIEKSAEKKGYDLKELVEMNVRWSQVIYEQNKKISRRLTAMTVASYLRLFIFIIPLILAFIFLPPIFHDLMEQYANIFGTNAQGLGVNGLLNNIDPSQVEGFLQQLNR